MLHFFNSPAFRIVFFSLIAIVLLAGIVATRARRQPEVADGAKAGGAKDVPPLPPAPPATDPIAVLEFEEAPGLVPIFKSRTLIGRHREDDVKVNDIRVSRHHALLVHSDGGGFEIHNQTAARSEPNDLLINGVYREHAKLTSGDRVTVGGVSFVFRTPAISHAQAV